MRYIGRVGGGMCGGVVAYVDGREGGPCEIQMGSPCEVQVGMRGGAGQWGETHGSIHGVHCGVFQST